MIVEEYKNYKIVSAGYNGMKEIKANGKGSIHMELRGLYTTSVDARRAIDLFESKKANKDDSKK